MEIARVTKMNKESIYKSDKCVTEIETTERERER